MNDKTELAALKARIEELERKANPPELPKSEGPRGPTTTEIAESRMAAMRVKIEPVDNATVAGIGRDARAIQNLAPLTEGRVRPPLPGGMREPSALEAPGGQRTQDLIGKLLDVDDARQRADFIAREAHRLAKK